MKQICSGGIIALSAAVVVAFGVSQIVIAGVTIHAGPTYNSSTGQGYRAIPLLTPIEPRNTTGDGIGIGYASKLVGGVDIGARAIRLNTNGWEELGHLGTGNGGFTASYGYSTNQDGTAVGSARKYTSGGYVGFRAVRWDVASTTAIELGHIGTSTSGSTVSNAYTVNDAGSVAGYAEKWSNGVSLGYRAVRWDAGGTKATELGHIGTDSNGSTFSMAYAINTSGRAVGYADGYANGRPSGGTRAVRWDAGSTTATELNGISTGNSVAYAINDTGTAVGFAVARSGSQNRGERAIRWDSTGTAATELGNLGLNGLGTTFSHANAINNSGTIVGYARRHNGDASIGNRAVRWAAGSTLATELGNLGTGSDGSTDSSAYAISGSGIAVGFARKYISGVSLGNRAVYWDLDAVAIDLNTLLSPADALNWTLTSATGISNTNWITGIGSFDPDGAAGTLPAYDRMFLVQIPTPGAAATLAFAGLFAAKRSRRRRA